MEYITDWRLPLGPIFTLSVLFVLLCWNPSPLRGLTAYQSDLGTECRSNVDWLLVYNRVAGRPQNEMELGPGPLDAVSDLTPVVVARLEGSVTFLAPLKLTSCGLQTCHWPSCLRRSHVPSCASDRPLGVLSLDF